VRIPTPTDPLAILPERMEAVTAQTRTIRAEPDSVLLHVGDAYDLGRVRVFALDAAGRVLGWYIFASRSIPVGAIRGGEPGSIVAARAGRDSVALHAPMWEHYGGVGDAPTVYVRFIIRP
jgi:hypothetical protein